MSAPSEVKTDMPLSQNVTDAIDVWVDKFPPEHKRSAVLQALLIAQKNNGGQLTHALLEAVAHYLGLPPLFAYEVATFYSLFELVEERAHPHQTCHKISVCTNVSCYLRGADALLKHLEEKLDIRAGENTSDGRFALRQVECLAACTGAPVLQIDDEIFYEDLTAEKIDLILNKLNAEGGGNASS